MLRTTRLLMGISAVAFAAADEGASGGGAPDNSKLRTHADLDAALGDREKPEGWEDFSVKQKQEWHGTNPPAPTPEAASGEGSTGTAAQTAPAQASGEGVVSIAESTQPATTEENPASTTRANDPERDSTVPATTTAEEAVGVQQTGEGEGSTDKPEHNELQAAGNRHSHPAQTTAEAGLREDLSEENLEALASQAMPAGEDADPANQPQVGEAPAEPESRHDESGKIQDATRRAIGAGEGAPDGVGDDGADPSESEVNDLVDAKNGEDNVEEEVAPGLSLGGGKLKLWNALLEGATRKELMKVSGYRSVEGTIAVLGQYSGRAIETTTNADGERVYKLAAVDDGGASV